MPNATLLRDTHVGFLPLSNKLSKAASKTRILRGLRSASLISLGQLADDGCTTTITAPELIVKKDETIILKGKRNYNDGLYDIPIYKSSITPNNYVMPKIHSISQLTTGLTPHESTTPKQLKKHYRKKNPYDAATISDKCMKSLLTATRHRDQKVNVILRKQQKSSDLAEFLHGCACGPVSSTFVTAIQNKHFVTWPGLTPDLIRKHLPPSRATVKSHLHQESQGLQSTKHTNLDNDNYINTIRKNIARLKSKLKKDTNLSSLIKNDIELDAFPPSPSPNVKTHDVCYIIIPSTPKGIGYIDLTGRFPFSSAKGNEYILVAYHFDANAIYVQAIKK